MFDVIYNTIYQNGDHNHVESYHATPERNYKLKIDVKIQLLICIPVVLITIKFFI